ncbi:MAG: DUF2817 domain-containing protein [Candidatus Zixiibacteriota bacterium]|nr:MAG: DUF2817 domain-containing protein [candidate division Zixibacteria bacterium]
MRTIKRSLFLAAAILISSLLAQADTDSFSENMRLKAESSGQVNHFKPLPFERISKIKIPYNQSRLREVAIKLHLDIERGDSEYVYCFATQRQLDELSKRGINFEIEYLDHRDETAWIRDLLDLGEYHTPDEMAFILDSIATEYPGITFLDTIGYSVEGRVIQALIISDNPGIEEDETEVRITGAHHGNEMLSAEIPLYLIDHLVSGYGLDPEITYLVNELELWIIPMVNPDGVHYVTRNNANNVNLNRNYLCPEGDLCLDGANIGNTFTEPETQAIRSTNQQNRFALSLTMHTRNTGPPLICWIWGYSDILHPSGTYHATEDDNILATISATYESLNNTPGFHSINGCDWYAIHGCEDDYAYTYWGNLFCAIELSGVFIPPEEEIEQYWLDNRDALMYFLSMANTGIRGIVRDAATNDPLEAGVKVLGQSKKIYADSAIGDYHRVLLPGRYGLRYEAPGYISQHVYDIVVTDGEATRVDVNLQPTQPVVITLEVKDNSSGINIPAQIKMTGVSFDTLFYYDGSQCILNIPADIYLMEVYSEGYIADMDPLEALENSTIEIPMSRFTGIIFTENFETGLGNWSFGGPGNQWGLYNPGYGSPNCLADSPQGYYVPNANTYVESNFYPNFEPYDRSGMYYRVKYEIEYHYDMTVLEFSTDGGTTWFDTGDTLTGSSNGQWEYHYADFDSFCVDNISSLIWGFRLASDFSIQHDGIYLDDIVIGWFDDQTNIGELTGTLPRSYKLSQNYPNPFNAQTSIQFSLSEPSDVTIRVYDLLGRQVRTLIDESVQAGEHRIAFDASDLSSGVYFYRLQAGDRVDTRRMILLK